MDIVPVLAKDDIDFIQGEVTPVDLGATHMGFSYWNNTQNVKQLTAGAIEFVDDSILPAEMKIIISDWKSH